MSNYSHRVHQWHTVYSNMAEDILATTLFLPLTIALHFFNSIADVVSELDFLPRKIVLKESDISSTHFHHGAGSSMD